MRLRLIALATAVFAPLAHGDDLNVDDVMKRTSISGFLSIRGGQLFDKEVNYLNTLDDAWSFSDDSVVGVQFDTHVSESTDVSVQVKTETDAGTADIEWAYLDHAFASDLRMRAGRLRVPAFMLSEFIDVGYAYPWVIVPEEVYGWLPFSRYEGLDLRYWRTIGDVDWRITPYAGTTSGQKLSIGNTEYADQSSRFGGLDIQASYDVYSFRIGYSRYRFELKQSAWDTFIDRAIDGTVVRTGIPPVYSEIRNPGFIDYVEDVLGAVPGTQDQLTQITTPANAQAVANERQSLLNQLDPFRAVPGMNGSHPGEFAGIGFGVDDGVWLVMSEVSRSRIGGVYPDVDSGYVMTGHRIERWMPYLTVAKMYTTDDHERPSLKPLTFDPALLPANGVSALYAGGANQFADVLIGVTELVRLEQQRYTLGVRWDALDSLALKAELFQVDLQNDSYGFALPESLVSVADTGANTTIASVEVPDPPSSITGVRISMDLVF